MNGMSDVRLTLHGQELEAGQARAMSAPTRNDPEGHLSLPSFPMAPRSAFRASRSQSNLGRRHFWR